MDIWTDTASSGDQRVRRAALNAGGQASCGSDLDTLASPRSRCRPQHRVASPAARLGAKPAKRSHTRASTPHSLNLDGRAKDNYRCQVAVSTGQQHEFKEFRHWCRESEGLTRRIIQAVLDVFEVRARALGEVGALGQLLAQEDLGVLIRSSLPR